MITYNGATWTDKDETYAYLKKFQEKHGHNIAEPACMKCNATTCYIVEETKRVEYFDEKGTKADPTDRKMIRVNFKRPGLNLAVKLMRLSYFIDDGLAFIVVTECSKCAAARAGFYCGLEEPDRKAHYLELAKNMPMNAEERADYNRIFNAAWTKGALSKQSAAKKPDVSRYTPKQGASL